MNRDLFEGKWHEVKGKIKEKWGKLTDDDVAQINGKYEQLVGRLQKR
ncbi:MAG: CsbD family protein, partial [Chlamydiota bacterium]